MDLLILKNDLAILVLFMRIVSENQHVENTHTGLIHPLCFQEKYCFLPRLGSQGEESFIK